MSPQTPRKCPLSVWASTRVDPKAKRLIRAVAAARDLSVSGWVRSVVEKALEVELEKMLRRNP